MSIDTTSHLYRVIFLQEWFKKGIFPFWSPDWYGGSPAVLIYPPLGYYLAIGLAMTGVDPVLSYKIVDAGFYCIAPIMVYLLGKELGISRGESALAALLFSIVPEVIENYFFFDRFPTVISIPIFCAFVIMFHRTLEKPTQHLSLLGSIFAMSALLITHHLSALIAGIVALLMVILASARHGFAKPIGTLIVAGFGTLGVTAFWLVPFIKYVSLFSANEFYNRNVVFPFLRFTYFGFDVVTYLLGIAQFILAAVAVQSIAGRLFAREMRVSTLVFFPVLLIGMGLFQAGEVAQYTALGEVLKYTGELVVVSSFVAFLAQFIVYRELRRVFSKQDGTLLAIVWFIAFLWLGLGYYALPVLQLPYLSDIWIRTMDVYRIWLYLALPMSVLAARGLLRSATRLYKRKPILVVLLLALATTPITVGVALKVDYGLNHPVNPELPYTAANAEIPSKLIDYFRKDPSSGRILGIEVPLWIYVLPNYVNKPILDGWYPQSKLVTPLVHVNDYRIDDLETTNDTTRLAIWSSLITNAQQLDLTWVIFGNRSSADSLYTALRDANFTQEATIPYHPSDLLIFKASDPPTFVEAPKGILVDASQPNPDKIELTLNPVTQHTTIVVKEAYFPTWAALADGRSISIGREPTTGYIQLTVPTGTRQITLYQTPQPITWNMISIASLALCLAGTMLTLRKRRVRR